MAVLSIRNLPDEVRDRLRVRAALAGRSMEAEARAILAEACAGYDAAAPDPAAVQDWVADLYGADKPRGVVDDLLRERREEASVE